MNTSTATFFVSNLANLNLIKTQLSVDVANMYVNDIKLSICCSSMKVLMAMTAGIAGSIGPRSLVISCWISSKIIF